MKQRTYFEITFVIRLRNQLHINFYLILSFTITCHVTSFFKDKNNCIKYKYLLCNEYFK